ncbi:hypothetical protein OKA04_07805 [Luteolibacter flavescens]|uniref:Uncharacterized protein n=1 Tax=Luteolibacter flavescens TaxID=1859460 RepID=A0ABT3FM41_9BACT|nr:hypothetical protein [Luteolibacter flavescens]MCW1884633.1 hypothetical protein [Luteolibacter flavescens]
MTDPAQRFIAAATSPLGDNAEHEIIARNELQELIGRNAGTKEAALDEAAARMEKAGKPKRWSAWRIALYSATAVISVLAFNFAGRAYDSIQQVSDYFGGPLSSASGPSGGTNWEERLLRDLTPEQRLLLMGDTSRPRKSERIKALWNSDPFNPAYYAEYTILFQSDHKKLPPDFLETARKLDPDNAWFILMEAAQQAKESVRMNPRTAKEKKDDIPPTYTVLDEAKLDEVIALIKEAGTKPRFDSYQASLLRQRIPLLPKRTDFVSQTLPLAYLAGLETDTLRLRSLADAVNAQCAIWATAGDAESFRELAAKWESCLSAWSQTDGAFIIDPLILKAIIGSTARGLEDCAKRLDMNAEAERWGAVTKWMKDEKDRRDSVEIDSEIRRRGGIFAGLTIPAANKHTARAPVITDEDLKPAREAEHEFLSRVFTPAPWSIIGLMAFAAAVYRLRGSAMVRAMALSLGRLPGPRDWAWIIGGGVILPFFYYQFIYRLSPWGGRDWSIMASDFIVPSGQFAAAGWLMIMMPVIIARWRVGKRAEMLGFRTRPRWIECIGVILGALSIPVFGVAFQGGAEEKTIMIAAGVMLGTLLLAWVIAGARALFGKQQHSLRRIIMTRMLVPAYMSGMLLLAVATWFYHAAERRWTQQDRLMDISAEAPSISGYEYEVAKAMREELQELLKP